MEASANSIASLGYVYLSLHHSALGVPNSGKTSSRFICIITFNVDASLTLEKATCLDVWFCQPHIVWSTPWLCRHWHDNPDYQVVDVGSKAVVLKIGRAVKVLSRMLMLSRDHLLQVAIQGNTRRGCIEQGDPFARCVRGLFVWRCPHQSHARDGSGLDNRRFSECR
jgi:hypothetical protein